MTWDDLIARNKRIIDPVADRYFFIENPKKIKIKNAPKIGAKAPLHPNHLERGFRALKTTDEFYIQDNIEKDKVYRLIHLFNFSNKEFMSVEHDPRIDAKMIHWLPVSKDLVKVEIIMPDSKIKKGLGEPLLKNLKENNLIQFERLGFCRLDKKEKSKLIFYFAHN